MSLVFLFQTVMESKKLAVFLLLGVFFEILLLPPNEASPWWSRRRRRSTPSCSSSKPGGVAWVNNWQGSFSRRCPNGKQRIDYILILLSQPLLDHVHTQTLTWEISYTSATILLAHAHQGRCLLTQKYFCAVYRLLAVRFSLEVCVEITRIAKLGRGGLGTRHPAPIPSRSYSYFLLALTKHSTDLKRKGGVQAVYVVYDFTGKADLSKPRWWQLDLDNDSGL